jgi:hypothetical protein
MSVHDILPTILPRFDDKTSKKYLHFDEASTSQMEQEFF